MVAKKSTKKPAHKKITRRPIKKPIQKKSTVRTIKKKSVKKKAPKKSSNKNDTKSTKVNKNEGYCVLYISHRGIGRHIVHTEDMKEYKKKDIWADYIVCDKDLKKAKQKLKIKMDKEKEKQRNKKRIKHLFKN